MTNMCTFQMESPGRRLILDLLAKSVAKVNNAEAEYIKEKFILVYTGAECWYMLV